MRVVGQAAKGTAAGELARDQAPDVVGMDLAMPGLGGVEATRRILDASPNARVLVLTASAEESDVLEAVTEARAEHLVVVGQDDPQLRVPFHRRDRSLDPTGRRLRAAPGPESAQPSVTVTVRRPQAAASAPVSTHTSMWRPMMAPPVSAATQLP